MVHFVMGSVTGDKNTGELTVQAGPQDGNKDLKETYESTSSGKSALENMIASHPCHLEDSTA